MRFCGDCMVDKLLIRAISQGVVHDVSVRDHRCLDVVVCIVAKAVDRCRCFLQLRAFVAAI